MTMQNPKFWKQKLNEECREWIILGLNHLFVGLNFLLFYLRQQSYDPEDLTNRNISSWILSRDGTSRGIAMPRHISALVLSTFQLLSGQFRSVTKEAMSALYLNIKRLLSKTSYSNKHRDGIDKSEEAFLVLFHCNNNIYSTYAVLCSMFCSY